MIDVDDETVEKSGGAVICRIRPEREPRLLGHLAAEGVDAVGEIPVAAQVTEGSKDGSVWTTPRFAAASANRLTNDVLDERAKSRSTRPRRPR